MKIDSAEPDLVVVKTRRDRRRARITRRRVAMAAVLVPLVIAAAVTGINRAGRHGARQRPPEAIGAGAKPVTYLVMTVRAGDLSRQADTLTVFTIGGGAQPYALLIPSNTLTEIPGYGFDSAGRALSFGRVPLAVVTVENILGVRVDHTAVIDDGALARLVDRIGGVRIAVPSNLFASNGQGTLVPVFAAGTQSMNGKQAMRYLTYQGPDETELSRLAREQQIWEAIFARYTGDAAGGLARKVAGLGEAIDGDAGAAALGRYLAAFASVGASARTYDDLSVTPVGGGGSEEAFRVNADQLAAQVSRFMAHSITGTAPRPRLQLLNGNGTPEAGVAVASMLIPAGF